MHDFEILAPPIEIESKALGSKGEFEGYASVFDIEDLGGDTVLKGAYAETLKNDGTPAYLWSHDMSDPIGEWLDLREDGKGLKAAGRLFIGDSDMPTEGVKKAFNQMRTARKLGLSIGYKAINPERTKNGGRRLTQVKLIEISGVLFPMNQASWIDRVKQYKSALLAPHRKAAEWVKTERDFEQHLRDEGWSNAAAKSIAISGFKAKPEPRDEDGAVVAAALNELRASISP